MYRAVDCLGFAGGFTLGMVQTGFELVGKRELPGGFGVPNCEANRHLLGTQWQTEIGPSEMWSRVDAEVVFGNPPCSGFSVMTAKGSRGIDAKINACMWGFSNYVALVQPVISVMESVRQAHVMGHDLMLALRDNVEEKTGLKYDIHHVYQDAIELGGAARRPRYFFVLSQIPFGVEYPTVTPPTLRDVIGDLEGLHESWDPQPYRRPASWWAEPLRSDAGVVDGHVGSHATYVERCMNLFEESGWDWPQRWHLGLVLKRFYEQHGELPTAFKPMQEKILAKDFQLGFTTMSRWPEDEPARVITGAALGSVMHPWLRRTITNREAARIMGFPDDWQLRTLRGNGLAPTHGKGITVQCGKWIGKWVARSLDGSPGSITGHPVGDREFFIAAPKDLKKHLVASQRRDQQSERISS